MNNTDLLTGLTAALDASEELHQWSQTNFSRNVLIFDGTDVNSLPQPPDSGAQETGEYPFLAVDIEEKETGYEQDSEEVVLELFLGLVDDSSYTEQQGSNIRQLPGKAKRETFRTLVLDVAEQVLQGYGNIAHCHTVNLPVEYFPEFGAILTLTLKRAYEFRDDRLR